MWTKANYNKGVEDTELKYKKVLEDLNKKFEEQIDDLATRKFCEHGYVDPKSVFQVSQSGIPYIGLDPITKGEAGRLKDNAKVLKQMDIWKVIQETIRDKAVGKAVIQSENWEQVLAGKMMLHCLGLIKAIVNNLEDIDVDKIAEHSGVRETNINK